jgi:HEAT repeat protein
VWRFVALLLALVAGVGAAMWYYRSPQAGMPVRVTTRNDDRWLDNLQSRNPKEVEAATAEIESRGTAALPLIRQTLQDDGASEQHRKAALKACAILGVRAAEAIPDIAALLSDQAYSAEAALALSFMGSAAVPVLKEAVDDDDPAVRKEALRSLGKLRERASIDPQVVIPMLIAALDDGEAEVRVVAVTYLGIVRDNAAKEVPALTAALGDDDAAVRAAAATALGAYGHAAESALPALRKAVKDPDEQVQREAGRAIITISEKQAGGTDARGTRAVDAGFQTVRPDRNHREAAIVTARRA